MKIVTLTYTGDLVANTQLLFLNDRDVVAFDLGQRNDSFKRYLENHNLNLKAVFITHGHFDHICGLRFISKDIPLYISKEDAILLTDPYKNCSSEGTHVIIDNPYIALDALDIIKIDNVEIQVINTPFHTLGSVCYMINHEDLITGDTLFKSVIGRCDLPTSCARFIDKSLKRLKDIYQKYGDMNVYPGHGENTTLKREVEKNFYMRNIK